MPPRRAASARRSAQPDAPPLPSVYPGLKSGKGMGPEEWHACVALLAGVYSVKDGSRNVSNIFRDLPDKNDYADYYETIPEPECLDHIASQLSQGAYLGVDAFFKQLHLVFLNAKHYNEDGSQVWLDAHLLETQILSEREDINSAATMPLPGDKTPAVTRRRGRPGDRAQDSSADGRKSATPNPSDPSSALHSLSPYLDPGPLPGASTIPVRSRSSSTQAPDAPVPAAAEKYQFVKQRDRDRSTVAQLDVTLPRWEGPQAVLPGDPAPGGVQGSGWWGEGAPAHESAVGGPGSWQHRMRAVIAGLAGYRDPSGKRLSDLFNAIPAVADIPYLSFHAPLSFQSIQLNTQAARYRNLRDLDMDMSRLFEKARRWYPDGSIEYGNVLVLQRLYNAMTAVYPLPLPPSGIPEPSSSNFASVPAGPGNARSLHEATQNLRAGVAEEEVGYGITTYRIATKDREFTEEARMKGQSYRCGDYVHLINPDDATRPIIGQVFKTFIPTKGPRSHYATICWYFRPEQTVHTADRTFFEREAFKTGHLCDHPIEDVLEKISVQFYVKFVRGRPKAPEFYPGWPSYVCHSRYNDREYSSVRVKNWNSCIPDELRQTWFMSVIPYERMLDPVTLPSPFLRGITGPGFIGEARAKPAGDEEEEYDADLPKKRDRRPEPTRSNSRPSASKPTPPRPFVPLPQVPPAVPIGYPSVRAPQPVLFIPGPSRSSYIPSPPTYQPPPSRPSAPNPMYNSPNASLQSNPGPAFAPRSLTTVMGGQQAVDQLAIREPLPHETARLFERDVRSQVLWFSGPPMPPGAVELPQQTAHSLEYLAYLSKRKRQMEIVTREGKRRFTGQGVDDSAADVIPTEVDLTQEWWAQGQTEEHILSGLRDMIETR